MGWAPIVQLETSLGEERGTLVKERRAVVWVRNERVYRRFTLAQRPLSAVFARFPGGTEPQELWVVIVCKDRLIYSYGIAEGNSHVVGLDFLPTSVVPCGSLGVVFTFSKPRATHLSIKLLQGPQELLKDVAPSSVSAPLRTDDVLKFCDDNSAIVWSEVSKSVKVLSLKFLHHSTQVSSAITSDISEKAAIYSFLREWPQKSIGTFFCQKLTGLKYEGGTLALIATHDPKSKHLYVLFGSDLARYDDIRHVVPLKGVKQFPCAVTLLDSTSELSFSCLFFPQIEPLSVQFIESNILKLVPNPDSNWFDCCLASKHSIRLALEPIRNSALSICFDIILELWGPTWTAKWLMIFLAAKASALGEHDAFTESFSLLHTQLEPNTVSKFIVYLHMLCEDLSLTCTHADDIDYLSALISLFAAEWNDAWRLLYGEIEPLDSASESSTEFEIYASRIPCLVETPPSVYSAFTHFFNPSVESVLPEFVASSGLYPTTVMVVELFGMLSLPGSTDDVKAFLIKNRFPETVELFCSGVKACIIEIMGILGVTPYESAPVEQKLDHKQYLSHTEPASAGTQLTEKFDSIIKGLFPHDLRFNEAVRLLQTDCPQKCLFGIYHNPKSVPEHQLARLKKRWAESLSGRALATAFGRAALDMGLKTPLLWEQLEAPSIDFSGVCTETGIVVTPAYSDLKTAAEAKPWGIFAQGVTLGLSVCTNSLGIDSLWVITSAALASSSNDLYSGFVYGMGLSGHLANLEDWQFYESLVSSNSRGTVAALLGVSASKRGSRDSKLTKVLSVHIKALLPAEAHDTQLVPPEVERAALISMGLLYMGQGVLHLTEALICELNWAPSDDSYMNDARLEHHEAHKLAVGLALGLINCGGSKSSGLDQLLSFVTGLHDNSVYSTGAVGGALVALLLNYVGSNNEIVAYQVQLPRTRAAAEYSTPNTFFSRAFTFHMIMWDSIGTGKQWVSQNVPIDLKINAERGSTTKIDSLWYYYSLTGALVAMAMRHTATNNSEVIDTILSFIEHEIYGNYLLCLKELSSNDVTDENEDPHSSPEVDYDTLQAAKHFARLLSSLVLALGAVAAGSGNLSVFKLTRKLWQVGPQFVASVSPNISASVENEVGLDMTCISQAIGWLFMCGGQRSLKCDPLSVGFLSAFSFLDLFGGGAICEEEWQHLRFFWSLCTESRCLYARNDPSLDAQIEVELRSGEVLEQRMPSLLPPLQLIKSVRIIDGRYIYQELDSTNLAKFLEHGVIINAKEPGRFTLGSMLPSSRNKIDWDRWEFHELRAALEALASHPTTINEINELQFLLAFSEALPTDSDARLLKTRDLEQLKFLQGLSH